MADHDPKIVPVRDMRRIPPPAAAL